MIQIPKDLAFLQRPGSNHVRVANSFSLEVDGQWIYIPKGDDSDGNTVPGQFQGIIPRYGWNLLAGIVHDALPRSVASDTVWRKLTIHLGQKAGVCLPKTRAWIGWSILAFTTVSGFRALAVQTFEG